ncbi:MAG TPA: hypothetical protein VM493_08700 [Vicinamibacterales bacterium]|nr:hypothetical protein [Vicinamibacterales bacterium]
MRVRIALGLSSAAIILSMGAIGYSAVNNGNRVNDVDQVLNTIQGERIANTRRACEQQNDDNTRVVKELTKLTRAQQKAQKRPPLTVKQKRQQHQTIIDFADAVHQRRDCNKVVAQSTGRSQAKQ